MAIAPQREKYLSNINSRCLIGIVDEKHENNEMEKVQKARGDQTG